MLWINLLHLYQPINAEPEIVEEATEKSYKSIISYLEKYPETRFTLNISGCLILRWKEMGYEELITRIKKLVAGGQVELMGSAAFHPILPLLPEKEVEYQINRNSEILKENFGPDLQLRGFFFPEMAYGKEAARIVKEAGFEWIIADEIAYNGKLGQADTGRVYRDENSGLKVVFRFRFASNNYAPVFLKENKEKGRVPDPVVTATDGEIYGLRHIDREGALDEVLKDEQISTQNISGFIDGQKQELETVPLASCNWESSEEEIAANKPYILWYDNSNKIHKKLWKLAFLAHDTMKIFDKDPNYKWARWHWIRGVTSCTFWWSSAKDFSHIFGPHAWSPDEIEKGLNDLIRSVRSLEDPKSKKYKLKAEKLYIVIKKMIWKHHWLYYWKNINQG